MTSEPLPIVNHFLIFHSLNNRFDVFPRWRNLNHFSRVTNISFSDGNKLQDISKVEVLVRYI